MSVVHTIPTTIHQLVAGHDWVTVGIQLAAPIGSLVVSGVALWFSKSQGQRASKIAEWQTRISAEKLYADQYDRRFEAWDELTRISTARYELITSASEVEFASSDFGVSNQAAFDHSATKVFFLFGDEMTDKVDILRTSLSQLINAKASMHAIKLNPANQANALDSWSEALTAYDNAMTAVRLSAREEIGIHRLSSIPLGQPAHDKYNYGNILCRYY
jgi:hypothetical protein